MLYLDLSGPPRIFIDNAPSVAECALKSLCIHIVDDFRMTANNRRAFFPVAQSDRRTILRGLEPKAGRLLE